MTNTPSTIFAAAHKAGASDIHIAAGTPVLFRIDGELMPQGKGSLSASQAQSIVRSILGPANYKVFTTQLEIDVAYALNNGVRFRVNCHYERGNAGLVARIIPTDIPSLEEIGMNIDVFMNLCTLRDGLILFTGPTGSGKSTSLAAMIQHISSERAENIVTLEDPIEFLFEPKNGVVRQRQLGDDFTSFPEALKRVLRQDPNIIMVGEMRDMETIATALTLAETGHLIFATLHTPNVVQTVDRIVDVFPPHQQHQIRTQLALSLKAVVAQRLIPCEKGGRIAQREILINTHAVANILRENRAQELGSAVQTGGNVGMCTFEKDAKRLLKEGLISAETYEWASK